MPLPRVSERDGEQKPARGGPVFLPCADADITRLITCHASACDLPARPVRRVIARESGGNPAARNGPCRGLMQISHPTARTMGYRGPAEGLPDAGSNLRYAVKYLAGACMVAEKNEAFSIHLHARGFYYDAKRKGLPEKTGLHSGPDALGTAPPAPR